MMGRDKSIEKKNLRKVVNKKKGVEDKKGRKTAVKIFIACASLR